MSLRDLVDAECGGANALMRMGGHMLRDAARKDDGLAGPSSAAFANRAPGGSLDEQHLVNEFLGQIAPAPQTFRMDALLHEMRQIDAQHFQSPMCAPNVIDQVNSDGGASWANEFTQSGAPVSANGPMISDQIFEIPSASGAIALPSPAAFAATGLHKQDSIQSTSELFDDIDQQETALRKANEILRRSSVMSLPYDTFNGRELGTNNIWADEFSYLDHKLTAGVNEVDWLKDFEKDKEVQAETNQQFNNQFWDRLHSEWMKISEEQDNQHPWLSEFTEYYDPYKEYVFEEENPMLDTENAFEKGKAFLAQGDIPSAVLCFEAAVRNDMENAEIWQLLGTSQAENEKDPNAIAALKKSLEHQPNNPDVFMALAISYTNESLQNQALKMLIEWLRCNPKYQQIVPDTFQNNADAALASSLIHDFDLREVQNIYLQAVQQNPATIDPEIQEALGVLFNLSAEFDKAADCFKAALSVQPHSAKMWNRLGASLANGNHSVDAVDAYQHALDIEPGYIRARYNVGIICINLKAYKEAIEHFLTALNHQATSMTRSGIQNPKPNSQMSDTIWSTMRMAVSLLGRTDLQTAIDQRDLDALNEAFKTGEEPQPAPQT